MSFINSNKKHECHLICAKLGTRINTKYMTYSEFVEENKKTLAEFKGQCYWIPAYPMDCPKVVKSNEWQNYSADLRFCIGSHDDGDGMTTRYLFIPRNVAKGNMKKIFFDLNFEEYYGGIGRAFSTRTSIIKIGRIGWLFSQSGGIDC